MNNTTTRKRNLALAAVFMAATLLVGTVAVITTIATREQSTAFAYSKKVADKKDGGGNDNGNTVTIEECKNRGSASGFDTATNQECENLICTHPGNNATCTQEGAVVAPSSTSTTPTQTPTIQVSGQGEGEDFCRTAGIFPASITFSVKQSGSAAVQGQFEVFVQFTPSLGTTNRGTLDSVQITGNSFTITGTELANSLCAFSQLPSSATISGQCGTGVTIQFATADGEHATFTGNVECTTT
jgi:hypothetical protein